MGNQMERKEIPEIAVMKRTTTGSEDFKKNILSGSRYIDKTQILIPLLRGDHETTFFLRPRRFGKTLSLSMIRYYVEDTRDEAENAENRKLFEGMKILEAGEVYRRQQTSFPVIALTLQGVGGESFADAYKSLLYVLQAEYRRHRYVLESGLLAEEEKKYFHLILESPLREENDPLPAGDAAVALQMLSHFLCKVHGRKTVVLLDEYDVPLEKAYRGGYYREMINVISPLLQNVLKTNSANLAFAVVTGCLRIAKESIYTGLNNPEVNTVLSVGQSDVIGFTEEETRQLLADSGFGNHFEEVRDWYDGYRFGKRRIYNPWSVIRHIENLAEDECAKPGLHWAGTSENTIIRELASRGSLEVKEKVEALLRGEPVTFRNRDDLAYAELDYHDDNVFSVMLYTGYLTVESFDGEMVTAVIPNKEVHRIFEEKIRGWFDDAIKNFDARQIYEAMGRGDVRRIREILAEEFLSSMSYYDTQEAYYHGVLLALLAQNRAFRVTSNRESGKGRFDLQCTERVKRRTAFIIEVKVSRYARAMKNDAERGARQVRTKRYAQEALLDGCETVRTYGIAFFEKDCAVSAGEVYTSEKPV